MDSLAAVRLCNFLAHDKSPVHAKSLKAFEDEAAGGGHPMANPNADMGALSGVHDRVPRIDSFVHAVGVVVGYSSFSDLQRRAQQDITSCLARGSDDSRQSARKLLACVAQPFYEIDRKVMRRAVCSSIAVDKSGDELLMYGRCLIREGLYDFLVGTESNVGHEISDTMAAITAIIKRAVTVPRGRRFCTLKKDPAAGSAAASAAPAAGSAAASTAPAAGSAAASSAPATDSATVSTASAAGKAASSATLASRRVDPVTSGPDDSFHQATYDKFVKSLSSAVADGGPVEQGALFQLSETEWPSLNVITRDRPHRYRSVIKGMFKNLDDELQGFFRKLLKGDRSLATMLQTNVKFSQVFQQKQKDSHTMNGPGFAKLILNLAYADHRYDSRSRPLFRFFRLLPVVIDTLEELSKAGEKEFDDFLATWGGDKGFCLVIRGAMAADAMVVIWKAIILEDTSAADSSLSGLESAKLLNAMQALFRDRGILMPHAKDMLTHAALDAMNGLVLVNAGSNAVPLRWPEMQSESRLEPARFAVRQG